MMRYVSVALNAAGGGTAAAPVPTGTDVQTVYENNIKHLKGVYVAGGAVGVRAVIREAGAPLADLDTSIFSNTHGPLPLEADYPIGQPFHVDLNNYNAGAQNGMVVVLQFDI